MKKMLLGMLGSVLLGSVLPGIAPAAAADLAARPYTKAPPPMVQAAYDWSGFYVGVNGGWAQSADRRSFTFPFPGIPDALFGDYDANGGTVGGQVGYRWQAGAWVFGLEAQGNWADVNGRTVNLTDPTGLATVRSKMDAFGLFTGQVGYAWNNVLLYAKGGAAVTDRNYSFFAAGNVLASSTGYQTQWSPTVGAGLEVTFAPNWSIGVEYDHIFEGVHDETFFPPAGAGVAGFHAGGDTDMVLGRLNYRFGSGVPIAARY
jgi:outer membrane immunogenic protein